MQTQYSVNYAKFNYEKIQKILENFNFNFLNSISSQEQEETGSLGHYDVKSLKCII